ncbi:MAG: SDR family mycofactocin-dependent oxidoreductase, partial [Chloroflexi bacterium]|nr:SDR family mycofactocin-dependent oxidoreductase [Chloroflexota bacterium]
MGVLEGKAAVITGGAGVLESAYALAMAREGADAEVIVRELESMISRL